MATVENKIRVCSGTGSGYICYRNSVNITPEFTYPLQLLINQKFMIFLPLLPLFYGTVSDEETAFVK